MGNVISIFQKLKTKFRHDATPVQSSDVLAARIARIRLSLERINDLMQQLREQGEKEHGRNE